MQAYFKVQGFGSSASSFVPNLHASHPEVQQGMRVPEMPPPMPMLPLPHQSMDVMMKAEWSPPASYEAAMLLGGPVTANGALNREARVLR